MSTNKIQSSLKNINFDELTAEEIITKYEKFLSSRERQVFELSSAVGLITQKLETLKPKYEDRKDKNTKLKIIAEKKEEKLKQELENKELLFLQLSNKEKECDEIKQKIDEFKKKNNKNKKDQKDQKDSNKEDNTINKDEKGNKKEDKKEDIKVTEKEKEVKPKDKNTPEEKEKEKEKVEEKNKNEEVHDPKSLAREKIKELTNKNEGMKKLNFAELLKKNQSNE